MGSNPCRKLSLLGFAHPVEGSPFQVQGAIGKAALTRDRVLEENRIELSLTFASSLQSQEIYHTRGKNLYHESLYNITFVVEHGIPYSNVYFNFMIQEKGWTIFCAHPQPRISLIVREFRSNLQFLVGSIVYFRGK